SEYQKYEIYDEQNSFQGYGWERTAISSHLQRSAIERRGRVDEYLLSLAANVNHKLFIGGSFSLVDLEYYEKNAFTEEDNYQYEGANLQKYTQTSEISHSGVGVNMKAGLIYRPFKPLRIGVAIHTPTFYSINFEYEKEISAWFDQAIGEGDIVPSTYHNADVEDQYEYTFQSPLRSVFSASYLLGNLGLISVDYELINYASSKFRAAEGDNYDYAPQNTDIRKTLKASSNLHVGAEIRATDNFSLRGGFEIFGNPWQKTFTDEDGSSSEILNFTDRHLTYSAGFGYRQQSFFIDFAYRLSQISESYQIHYMYYSNGKNIASLTEWNNQATLTIGFRF
ncbi:MAG TPA: hypothetical protein PLK12_10450, partial [Prolixibacteraceae bacterium]|nr:hypothetical protein [Prolixibacteraceae bacterium]